MAIEVDLGCEVVSMTEFLELTDTPSDYTGQAGYVVKVNGTEDGLIFALGGGGTGNVESVTGDGVNNTDPNNPVMSYPTPTDIGLGNVDNTSDLSKPISTATQTALDGKADNVITITKTADFTLSNDGGKRILVDSVTDVTVTADLGAGTDLKNIKFVKMGAGDILMSVLGTATVHIPVNKNAVVGTQYNTAFLQEISTDVFIWSGETN